MCRANDAWCSDIIAVGTVVYYPFWMTQCDWSYYTFKKMIVSSYKNSSITEENLITGR